MDKEDLKRIAIDAAMERVVGSSSVPARYLADLIKRFGAFVDEYKAERAAAQTQYEQEKRFLREIQQDLNEYAVELARIRQIKGEKGDDGKTPTNEELLALIRPLIPKVENGKTPTERELLRLIKPLIPKVRDGLDAVVEEKKLEELMEKFLDKHRERLENEVASYRSQLAGKHYGKDTWARGGGMTMSAGSNITLVPKADGTVEINASGGGSGTNVTTQYQLTAVQAGDDVTIDLTQLTNWATFADLIALYRNNIMQTETLNFTVSGSTVTIFNAAADEVFNVTYSYA